jgi:tRNA A-37 threonylcarbamoyl transferase component Bud32
MSESLNSEFLALQQALAGRYSLEREIGRGGMGIVYLAHEVRLDRPVALKLLPPRMAVQPALRERFLREARTAAKLSHPNIVPIHAVDEVDDFVFFAMAFVEGQSLGERIRERGPLKPNEAARVLREVAWALGHAHAHGVVHRDVKPDNILLEARSGRAMVTDFGIAHVVESDGVTGAADILGTAEFMSPEQASGESVDARSDLYALGVVGHYILSGTLPFQGSTMAATLAKQLTQEAPALASVAPEAPRNLHEAIDRCLSKDPTERFQSGDELAEALTDQMVGRVEVPAPLRLFAERNKQATTLIASTSMVGMVVIATILDVPLPRQDLIWVLAIAAWIVGVPVAVLTRMVRRLLRSGYGYRELLQALEGDVEQRRADLQAEYREPSRLNVWARRLLAGSASLCAAFIASIPFVPFAWLDPVLYGLLASVVTGSASAIVALVTHGVDKTVAGERWLKFWRGPLGRGVFRLSKLWLGGVVRTGPMYGRTEMAIGMAADRLFDGLPKDVRESFRELPDVVRALEKDGDKVRSRIKELNWLLAQVKMDETAGSGRALDKRDNLEGDLRKARDAADARLANVVAALESIRLQLLRMHGGDGSIDGMTADLGAAKELSGGIAYLLEGKRQVAGLLGLPEIHDALDTPTPTPA